MMGRICREMKKGDSIFCATNVEKECARMAIRALGGKYATRKVEGGWRVWRLG